MEFEEGGKRGVLWKKKGRTWKEYKAVCENGRLVLHKDPPQALPELSLDLREVSALSPPGLFGPKKKQHDGGFAMSLKDGTEVLLCAENAVQREEWCDVLSVHMLISQRHATSKTLLGKSGPSPLIKSSAAASSKSSTPLTSPRDAPDLRAELDKERARSEQLAREKEQLKSEIEAVRNDLAAAHAREQSLRKELELAKKLYKAEKQHKEEAKQPDTDSEWMFDSRLDPADSQETLPIMKKQLSVMAKKTARMRQTMEDLQDENHVLSEEVKALQQRLAAVATGTGSPAVPDDSALDAQLTELEQMLEECALKQAKYERIWVKYKALRDRVGDLDDKEDDDKEGDIASASASPRPDPDDGDHFNDMT